MSLRVMTWNLWWQFGEHRRREQAIVQVIREQDPDVVCLQEVWIRRTDGQIANQAAILAEQLGMHWVANDPVFWNDAAFANAILSRWPITRVGDQRLPGVDGNLTHRRMVMGEVQSPWGPWPVVSTHLEHRFDASATRTAQLTAVLAGVDQQRTQAVAEGRAATVAELLPTVIGADLNAVPDSDEVRAVTGRAPSLVPGLVLSDVWDQVGHGPGVTWQRDNPHVAHSAWPDRRIDYLLVAWPRPKPVGNPLSAHLVADFAVVVGDEQIWASDHAGLVAELCTPEVGVDPDAQGPLNRSAL
jgi:endonuclease/exonuclease/phosphatase family metal-dependent hydrolase